MIIMADENIDSPLIEKLRSLGYEVIAIDKQNSGASDGEILKLVEEKKATLITFDRDFVEYDLKRGCIIHITSNASYRKIVRSLTDLFEHAIQANLQGEVIRITPGKT